MHSIRRFNVRVYGILINSQDQVLVADEVFKNGKKATKFPGGGVELGEGLKEALQRELMEETGIRAEVKEHFYTTDFFQPSYFDDNSQIISIYYMCESPECARIKTSLRKFDFEIIPGKEAESFRWVNKHLLGHETDISLPIDQVVVKMLLAKDRVI